MKVVVFLYASLYFSLSLFLVISQFVMNFNTHKTIEHAYHRALQASIKEDLVNETRIENKFREEFSKMSPNDLNYRIRILAYNRSPKALRVEVLAKSRNQQFKYDETLIEEVYLD